MTLRPNQFSQRTVFEGARKLQYPLPRRWMEHVTVRGVELSMSYSRMRGYCKMLGAERHYPGRQRWKIFQPRLGPLMLNDDLEVDYGRGTEYARVIVGDTVHSVIFLLEGVLVTLRTNQLAPFSLVCSVASCFPPMLQCFRAWSAVIKPTFTAPLLHRQPSKCLRRFQIPALSTCSTFSPLERANLAFAFLRIRMVLGREFETG